MNPYYSVQDKEQYKSYALIKISIAWLMGIFAIWLWANEQNAVLEFFWVFAAYLAAAKILDCLGWKDFMRSKGYAGWTGIALSFFGLMGAALMIFLPDRWFEQQVPKLQVRRFTW